MKLNSVSDVFTLLTSMQGFADKVAFSEFPKTEQQTLPYICLRTPSTDTFGADNKVYFASVNVDIELYTKRKDTTLESAIEQLLTDNGIFYSKYESKIDSQSCYQVVYEIGV